MRNFLGKIALLALFFALPFHFSFQGFAHKRVFAKQSCSSCQHDFEIEICQEISGGQKIQLENFYLNSEKSSFFCFDFYKESSFFQNLVFEKKSKISHAELARSHLTEINN